MTRKVISEQIGDPPLAWNLMNTSTPFALGDLRVECFSVPHDATDPVGFVIADGESRLGVLSDVGHCTHLIRSRLSQCHGLFVEANYDRALLEADTLRPWPTKQRISSPHGHLSNEQTAELVASLAHSHLRQVVLGHLSDDCNRPELAADFVRRALASTAASQAKVQCAARHEPSPRVSLEPLEITSLS
jgi:phosphoribosyl 1,2-cyclic phosphodiesterase